MKNPLRLAVLTATIASSALANPIDQIRPDAPDLADYGTLPVGVQTLSLVNPRQIDVISISGSVKPRYDRPLTVEVWYPATDVPTQREEYATTLPDGVTQVTLTGRALRDARPYDGDSFPLIVISHGYPGNRYLMSHFGENLASKGYVVVSIDHTDSTYSDQAAFGSTLLNRPLDQRFVINSMAMLDSELGDIINTSSVGVVGYSMGGYGALVLGGAGVTQEATEFSWGVPNGLLERHMAGTKSHEDLIDPRVRAIVSIGPWGRNAGLWDVEGMAGLRIPTLFMAGSGDDVSVYETIRTMFEQSTGTLRHLLTFEYANHNAAAPIPAPQEAWTSSDDLEFAPFEHYADPVWDTVRMNNIAQHFTTAFMDLHLKGDLSRKPYFDLIVNADEGVLALDEEALPTEDHTYWTGFAPPTATGLKFETLQKNE